MNYRCIEVYIWVIDQEWGQDGWILANFFCVCLWTKTESRSINSQKKNEANIQPSWLKKVGQRWLVPSRQDSSILPAQVLALVVTQFGSSCRIIIGITSSRDGTVERGLASHQCTLRFFVDLVSPWGFFSGYSGFPHCFKTNISKFQFKTITSCRLSQKILWLLEVNVCLQCYINTYCLFPSYMCMQSPYCRGYRFRSILWSCYSILINNKIGKKLFNFVI